MSNKKSAFDSFNFGGNLDLKPSRLSTIAGVGGKRHKVIGQVTIHMKSLIVEQSFKVL